MKGGKRMGEKRKAADGATAKVKVRFCGISKPNNDTAKIANSEFCTKF